MVGDTGDHSDGAGEKPPPLSHDPRSWFAGFPAAAVDPPPPTPRRSGRFTGPIVTLCAALIVGALAVLMMHRPAATPPAPPHKTARNVVPLSQRGVTMSTRVVPIDRTQNLRSVLIQAGASGADSARVELAVEPYFERGGNRLELTFEALAHAAPRLSGVKLTLPDGSGVELTRHGSRFAAVSLSNHLVPALRVIRGEMDGDSFYTSAVAAGIDDRLVPDITSALAFEFDFAREIHKGDVFEIVVRDTINASGETIGAEELVFVRLVTNQRSVALYRFQPSVSQAEWFDAGGRGTRRGLMRTPVEGARVSSYYGMRMHPVLGFMRMHKGVDFATPVGTPVYAAGDGTIAIMGVKHGYGLYLRIDHSSKLATAYAHLSRCPPSIVLGAHVHQGDVVAYTGDTGELSTGPHLHYEVLVNGMQVDPLGMPVEQGTALTGADLTAFETARDQIDTLRQKGM